MTIYVTFYVNTLPFSTLAFLYISILSLAKHTYVSHVYKTNIKDWLAISFTYVVHLNRGPSPTK